mmetsp:Transcript_14021/g.29020  ORF Transcript_14021/g.29020 Transcript_14021/m.29020 type:complete len:247 (+) Transcript_14021:29-769(+)
MHSKTTQGRIAGLAQQPPSSSKLTCDLLPALPCLYGEMLSMQYATTLMVANDMATTAATVACETSLRASVISSEQQTHSIAPAANPRPRGSHAMKASTKRKTGAAMRGCGSEVQMLHSKVWNLGTPRGISTRATASPSGTLCTARLAEMTNPRCAPLFPQKDTPMPRPSAKECSVMTPTMSTILVASIPPMSASFKSSCSSRYRLLTTTKPMPSSTPSTTRSMMGIAIPNRLAPSPSSAHPSTTRL